MAFLLRMSTTRLRSSAAAVFNSRTLKTITATAIRRNGHSTRAPLLGLQRQEHSLSTVADDYDRHTGPLWDRYYDLLKDKDVHEDEHQHAALECLERLRLDLQHFDPPTNIVKASPKPKPEPPKSTFGSWFGGQSTPSVSKTSQPLLQTQAPQGVYMVGPVRFVLISSSCVKNTDF